MFKIEYSFSNSFPLNDQNVDEDSLRYRCFLGNVTLKDGVKVVMIDWDWIPLLDFGACLLRIADDLQKNENGSKEFEFTESDEKIIFERTQDKIVIAPTFSEDVLEIDFSEFKETVRSFYKDLITEILEKYDELRTNNVFFKYLLDDKGGE